MSLPELFFPTTLPAFMAAEHVRTPEGLYASVPRMSGGDRRRRVHISAPVILEASVELTQSQLEDFFAWHEGPLRAGEVPFTAPIAVVGSGLEYWSAICLSFKADHQEGSHHKLQVRLRLSGVPSPTLPVISSLYSEVEIALDFSGNAEYLNQMYSEVVIALQTPLENNAALESEVFMALFTEFDGPSATHTKIESEVYIPLNVIGIVDDSSAFESEVAVALLTTFIQDILLESEVSIPLLITITPTGPVASPASINEVASAISPFAANCSIALQIWVDGRVYTRKNSSAAVYQENWYLPTLTGVGTTYWVKIAKTEGVVSGGGTENASGYRPLSGTIFWTITESVVGGDTSDTATVTIATDPDGANVVSTFTAFLEAIYDV